MVLAQLLGDELGDARVDLLPLRGAKELPATIDSQFLFYYTDAHVVAMLDAVAAHHLQAAWHEALRRAEETDVQAAAAYLREQLPGKQPEKKWLREFLTLGLVQGLQHRLMPFGLQAGDIVEYLPASVLVPGHTSWSELRARHAREGGTTPFKPWLEKKYGADFSAGNIRAAAEAMDEIPSEFVDLLHLCQAL